MCFIGSRRGLREANWLHAAFCNSILLDEVEIPDGMERIDDCAFRGCMNLERVVIPVSVTYIGWGSFDGCESITLFCDEGSEIRQYCLRSGISEKEISEKEGL